MNNCPYCQSELKVFDMHKTDKSFIICDNCSNVIEYSSTLTFNFKTTAIPKFVEKIGYYRVLFVNKLNERTSFGTIELDIDGYFISNSGLNLGHFLNINFDLMDSRKMIVLSSLNHGVFQCYNPKEDGKSIILNYHDGRTKYDYYKDLNVAILTVTRISDNRIIYESNQKERFSPSKY